jgi:hypothetical protein
MREDRPVKTYWVSPSPGVRWLCKQYFDKHIILLDEDVALRDIMEMSVDLEADKLTNTLTSQMDKLTNKLAEANTLIEHTFGEAHDTVDVTTDHVKKIGGAFAKLKAMVGGNTNNPPPGALPT